MFVIVAHVESLDQNREIGFRELAHRFDSSVGYGADVEFAVDGRKAKAVRNICAIIASLQGSLDGLGHSINHLAHVLRS